MQLSILNFVALDGNLSTAPLKTDLLNKIPVTEILKSLV